MERIGSFAFSYCTELFLVIFSNDSLMTSILNSVYSNCVNLYQIIIPFNVSQIGSHAFFNCQNLKKIFYCGLTEPKISVNAFEMCKKLNVIYTSRSYKSKKFDIFKIKKIDNFYQIIVNDTVKII